MRPPGPKGDESIGDITFRRQPRARAEGIRAGLGIWRVALAVGCAVGYLLAAVGGAAAADPAKPSSAPAGKTRAGPQPPDRDTGLDGGTLSPDDVDVLLRQLADRQWRVRHAAARRLMLAGPRIFPRLLETFRTSQQHEVRLWVKEIAQEIFLRKEIVTDEGFLGIQQRPVTTLTDSRVPEGKIGILVARVVKDSAADRAGLETGDVIISFDGKPIPADRQGPSDQPMISPAIPGQAFSEAVRRVRAGTTISLGVLRHDRLLRLEATLMRRPTQHQDAAKLKKAHAAFNRWWAQTLEISDGRQ